MAYDLSRFLKAQERDYNTALKEIKAGHKSSHWIWYIFPQLGALGFSPTAKFYGIADLDEARAYLENNLLRTRLLTISQALLDLPSNDIDAIMGYPDNLKLCSSMTLFHLAEPDCEACFTGTYPRLTPYCGYLKSMKPVITGLACLENLQKSVNLL